jgi:hypothetical protein
LGGVGDVGRSWRFVYVVVGARDSLRLKREEITPGFCGRKWRR